MRWGPAHLGRRARRTAGDAVSPPGSTLHPDIEHATSERVSDELERWLADDGEKTIGGLIDTFGTRSFALVFVLLLGVPALPLPTGGATHVFELIAILLALQLVAGVHQIWLPRRWRGLPLAGARQQRFVTALIHTIRRLERLSKPRLPGAFERRAGSIVFGLLVIVGSLAAFLAPPFTGLDTLPSLGVVVLSVAFLLRDIAIAIAALVIGGAGIVLEIVLASVAVGALEGLL